MIDRITIILPSTLITIQNLVAVSHTVCAHAGSPFFLGGGRWGPTPLGPGVVDALETRYSPTCYRTKFRRSLWVSLGLGRGPKIVGGIWGAAPLGMGRG